MKASTKRFLIAFGYLATLAWIVPAFMHIVYQSVEQHHIFAMLRTVRYNQDEPAIGEAEKGLSEFGLEGLIYVIQELKQDEERDRRIKLTNVLERFLTGDSDRGRWGWGENHALRQLLDTWPKTPGRRMAELNMEQMKEILLHRKPGELKPHERRQLLNFAIEYALITLRWDIDEKTQVFRNRGERLRFSEFLALVRSEQLRMQFQVTEAKPEVELSGDQMKRAEDFAKDWLDKEAGLSNKLGQSEEADLAWKLQGFLGGAPVAFVPEECDKMIRILEDQRAKEAMLSPKLLPAAYASLQQKLRMFSDGAAVRFPDEDMKDVCTRLEKFKDDYISYAVEMKFKKTTEGHFLKLKDAGVNLFDIRRDEVPVVLKIIHECRREYAYARVQMARTARRIVLDLTGRRVRFQTLVRDLSPDLGIFEHIKKAWKAKNDEIVMLDLIDLLQDDDFGVRVNISDALVAIGNPAVYYLVEQLKKERVNSTAVVPTRDKSRAEREKELNAKNTQARKAVAMILGRIGSKEAEFQLQLMTRDPVIGATCHKALERLRRQKARK
ncbi:MAG: hypothetical protein GXP25_21535 [Planctomycetes bacterium]|nr:hypothetical protein [Planctomycetota bacterium]